MSYDAALTHPFHPKAKGARVPDQFVFPTTVYSTTVNYTVNCDANGNADFCVVPNPFVGLCTSMANTKVISAAVPGPPPVAQVLSPPGVSNGPTPVLNFGNLVQPATAVVGDPPVVPEGSFPVLGASAAVTTNVWTQDGAVPGYTGSYCPALKYDEILTYMSSWRIVGMGVRVRSLPSPQTQSGQFQCCTVPCPDVLPDPSISSFNGWLQASSFPIQAEAGVGTSLLQPSMIQYPASDMFMFAELTREGGLEWITRRTGAKADVFRASAPNRSLELLSGQAALTDPPLSTYEVKQTTNLSVAIPGVGDAGTGVDLPPVQTQVYDEYGYTCCGWSAFFCRFTGLPLPAAGTLSAPVVNVEVIFHLEGEPNITGAGGLVPNVAKGIYDVTYFSACCMKASAEPWFRRVIDYDRFSGRVVDSNAPLQVAMAGLLGSQRPQKISSKSRGLKRRFY